MSDELLEEDIKVLEENINNGTIYCLCGNTINKAIENLIARNKELEEKNFYLPAWVGKNYIPKSKVRERIEEYNKLQEEMTTKNHNADNINDCYKYGDKAQKAYYKKEALQELLEER